MHILNSVLGDASGGRWAVVCDYCRVLLDQGHTVTLLLNRRHPPDLTAVPAGAVLEFTRSHGHYDFFAALLLRRCLNPPPALAIAHCSRSVALLKRALPDTILLAVSHSNKVKRLLPADAYVALNDAVLQQFRQAGSGKPCFLLPNMIGVNTAECPRGRPRHEPVRIGALGRFDAVKGFDIYIKALATLQQSGRPFSAVLAGAGPEAAALQQMAASLGLGDRLEFSPWVKDADSFLASLDILCVPARSDAFGLTPLQAARAGTPMVLSRAAGHRQSFAEGSEALFADVGDADGLARELDRLSGDAALAERLRQAAFRRLVDCYSEPVVTERLLKVIETIIK